LAFAPLLLALPRRDWWRAALAALAALMAAWLPFLLYDPGTLNASRFTISTAVSSGLHVLGFTDPQTPSWDRPAQLLLGCLLGTIAVVRGRWPAVILLATSARILLDPEVYGYYTSGVLLGAVAFELIVARYRLPWLTMTGALALQGVRMLGQVVPIPLEVMGWLRVGYVALVIAVVLLPARRRSVSSSPSPGRRRHRRPTTTGRFPAFSSETGSSAPTPTHRKHALTGATNQAHVPDVTRTTEAPRTLP
jgi:hypothetical protein